MAKFKPTFVVAPRCSVLLPSGKRLAPGTILPDGLLKAPKLEDMVRSGHLLIQGHEGDLDPTRIPGVESSLPAVTSKETPGQVVTEQGSGLPDAPVVRSTRTVNEPVEQAPSPWTHDPADLDGKDLDQLNAMVIETDPEVPAFETVEEAVAFLSQDHKPGA